MSQIKFTTASADAVMCPRLGDVSRRSFLVGAAAGAAALPAGRVLAQVRGDTLLVVQELGFNSLDMHGAGSNFTVNGIAWNCYDRLMTYAGKTLPGGTQSYDPNALAPELAESWVVAPDGMSCTFKLRRDAKFHDGSPVTARDVKWSFDRAVSMGGFPTFQMAASSLEKPEQFVAVDDHTFRVDYLRKDKLVLFNLAVVIPFVINSELARKHATADDPWAAAWLKANEAGGGAYRVERWTPGSETVLARFDGWTSGPLPKIGRIVIREVPSAGTRRAVLERGDADVSFGLPAKDFEQMATERKLKVASAPLPSTLWFLALNTSKPPFDNVKLRQAIAWAIPYEQIQANAFFGRAAPMYGGSATAETAAWPQPFPYVTNLDKAKALMVEAGFAQGLETTLAIDTGRASVGEPTAVLIQESLAKIGIRVTINKISGANWQTSINGKQLPMMLSRWGAWLDYPEYYFFWNFHGSNSIHNISCYRNPAMDALIETARFTTDAAEYDKTVKAFIALLKNEVPVVPLNQPFLDVAMATSVSGYRFWFHQQLDYRSLAKA